MSTSLLRYSADPRLAQEKASSKASAECSTMLATFSCASFARATDFSNKSMNDDGISGRSVPTAGLSSAGAAEARLPLDILVCVVVSFMSPPLSKRRWRRRNGDRLVCWMLLVQAAAATALASSTHASRANQRWLALHIGQ